LIVFVEKTILKKQLRLGIPLTGKGNVSRGARFRNEIQVRKLIYYPEKV
jgi:hypothetical protein